MDIAETGGISGIETAEMTLTGVFLTSVDPPNVIEQNGIGTSFVVGIGGVFPIPPSATRLVLGMPDETAPTDELNPPTGYGDNTGQVSATYKIWNAATLTLSQSNGAPESSITLNGSGFGPNEEVYVYSAVVAGQPSNTAIADSTGSFLLSTREAQRPYGPEMLFAIGAVSGHRQTSLRTSRRDGTAIAVGFGASESVDIYWNNPRQLLATVTADALGSTEGLVTIPMNATPGLNGLLGIGQTPNAIAEGAIRVE